MARREAQDSGDFTAPLIDSVEDAPDVAAPKHPISVGRMTDHAGARRFGAARWPYYRARVSPLDPLHACRIVAVKTAMRRCVIDAATALPRSARSTPSGRQSCCSRKLRDLWDGIVSVPAARMASQQPPCGERRAAPRPMPAVRLDRVVGAARSESALPTENRAKHDLVGAHAGDQSARGESWASPVGLSFVRVVRLVHAE
jgi:hypothetical protein